MLKILPSNTFDKQTIIDWYYRKDQIDFEPAYQRVGRIWSKETKQYFLDSILNSLDVPKFYVHYFPDSNNELSKPGKMFSIVDGKQRMETIIDFIECRINLGDNIRYYNDEYVDLRNLTYVELYKKYPSIKVDFDNFLLDVVYIITDERDRIEELFGRLNEGEPLNNAEKRNSLGGEAVDAIREISKHNFFTEKVDFKNARYDYFDLTAKLLFLEHQGELLPLSKRNLDKFVLDNRASSNVYEALSRTSKNLDVLCEIFIDKDPLLKTKAVVPVYYWFFRNSYDGTNHEMLRRFIAEFNEMKNYNRFKLNYEDKNQVLLEFDRLNQQGTISKKSLVNRFKIISRYYDLYKKKEGILNLHDQIDTADLDLKEEE